jgi:hypothetical protein
VAQCAGSLPKPFAPKISELSRPPVAPSPSVPPPAADCAGSSLVPATTVTLQELEPGGPADPDSCRSFPVAHRPGGTLLLKFCRDRLGRMKPDQVLETPIKPEAGLIFTPLLQQAFLASATPRCGEAVPGTMPRSCRRLVLLPVTAAAQRPLIWC